MEKKKDLLLIVDMQNVYTAGQDWACWRIQKAADSILRLLSSGAFEDVIFTRFLASESPAGVWKDYNRVNDAINRDPWKNEMMAEFAPGSTKGRPVGRPGGRGGSGGGMLRALHRAGGSGYGHPHPLSERRRFRPDCGIRAGCAGHPLRLLAAAPSDPELLRLSLGSSLTGPAFRPAVSWRGQGCPGSSSAGMEKKRLPVSLRNRSGVDAAPVYHFPSYRI